MLRVLPFLLLLALAGQAAERATVDAHAAKLASLIELTEVTLLCNLDIARR